MKVITSIVMLIFVALFANVVSAAEADYEFKDADINGIQALNEDPVIHIERGQKVHIRVELESTNAIDVEDVRVRAWIGGTEHGRIEAESDIFTIENGIRYTKSLVLHIPEDIDASETYTLHIEAFDDDDDKELEFTLDIEEKRHDVNLFRTFFNPGLTIDQGDFLSIGVIVENLGDFKKGEKNVIVEASIPELGIVVADSIDELSTEDEADDESDKESTAKLDLPPIDLDVPKGQYELRIRAYYNRGNDFSESIYTLVVNGDSAQTASEIMINTDSQTKQFAQGTTTTYKVMVANLGNELKTLTTEVDGTQGFADVQITPNVLTLPAGGTNEFIVSLTAKDNASPGDNLFTVRVKEGSEVVGESNLIGNVISVEDTLQNVKTGLQIGFVVLLIILVILGIVIGVGKMGKSEDDEEGQTYY